MVRTIFYFLKNIILLFSRKKIRVSLSSRVKAKVDNIGGSNTFCSKCYLDGKIGKYSTIGPNSILKANIGRYCSIGPNVKTVSGNHPISFYSIHPAVYKRFYKYIKKGFNEDLGAVNIGNDVWIWESVLIKGGINIGDGAVIGMGSVVVKDVPPFAIVCGNPAKVLRYRFDDEKASKFLKTRWWNKDVEILKMEDFLEAGSYE